MVKKAFFTLLFIALVCTNHAFAENVPQPAGRVNDFANVISQEYSDRLTSLIQELEGKTNAEIAVVTITSIAPYDEKAYARMLFDSWKPGKKGKDNGVLVLLAIRQRRWRIETGYGLEGILPDGRCGEIGRNYMVPYFKAGSYGEGLYRGVAVISYVIAKDAGVTLSVSSETTASQTYPNVPELYIVIFFILLLFVFRFLPLMIGYYNPGGRNSSWGGSFGGGGFGGGGFGGGPFGGGGGGGGGAGGGF